MAAEKEIQDTISHKDNYDGIFFMLARSLLEQEQNSNCVRCVGANIFRLICKVGVSSGMLTGNAVKEALVGMEK